MTVYELHQLCFWYRPHFPPKQELEDRGQQQHLRLGLFSSITAIWLWPLHLTGKSISLFVKQSRDLIPKLWSSASMHLGALLNWCIPNLTPGPLNQIWV